jgi:hypothetical protein
METTYNQFVFSLSEKTYMQWLNVRHFWPKHSDVYWKENFALHEGTRRAAVAQTAINTAKEITKGNPLDKVRNRRNVLARCLVIAQLTSEMPLNWVSELLGESHANILHHYRKVKATRLNPNYDHQLYSMLKNIE